MKGKGSLAWLYGFLFLFWIFLFPQIEEMIRPFLSGRATVVIRAPLYILALQHLFIAGIATLGALLTGLFLGSIVRLTDMPELRSMFLSVSTAGEAIPTAAIIALSVPVLGYGNIPCIVALYIYAVLPILRNVVTGFYTIPSAITEAGKGMGMTPWQLLWKVDFPLAKPVILAGLRTAVVICLSAATIGATIGAGGFGVPILSGIRVFDPLLLIRGSVPVILLALFADRIFR